MVTVPSRDHTIAQVCPPCPPPALGSVKSSGRRQEAMERGISQPFYTSCKSEHSSEFLRPPLQAKAGMTALQLTRLENKARNARAWQHVSLWGCFSFQKSYLKRRHESGKEAQQNSQNYFKWKDFILAQIECVMILLSSFQWTHNLTTVLSKSNFSWFLSSKNLEL